MVNSVLEEKKTNESLKGKISIRNLEVSFGDKKVIKNISLDFCENKITAIIGPSGCGKSTLLRTINRMTELAPTSKIGGEIIFDGKDIFSKDVDIVNLRKRVGMVFQRPNPFPKSIYENIAYGLRINGIRKKSELDEMVLSALDDVGLLDEVKNRLNDSAFSLSGGQQQRLCLARALALKPEVILLDEPASALDPISTYKLEELLLKLKEKYTIIIVTHNMQQAARVSDYVAFIYFGEIVEYDKTDVVFTHPAKKLTEDYVSGKFG